MKHFHILTLVLTVTLMVSACGARVPASPTLNPADLQSTIAAVGFTMYAQTQAAIPTATPVPPTATFTNTPTPTNTFPPLPASQITLTPVPGGNSTDAQDCIHKLMPDPLQGEKVKVRINNNTRVALTVSVNLQQTPTQPQCGYRTYSVAANQPVVINDLIVGCYTIWAWNPDPKNYFIVTNGTSCIDSSYPVAFDISNTEIKLR